MKKKIAGSENKNVHIVGNEMQPRRDRDRMVVGFTTTCAISTYHH